MYVVFPPLYLLTPSWSFLFYLFYFLVVANNPPRDAFAVHPSKSRSRAWQSTSRYHHKACPPRAKCHSARLSPFPGSVPPMDCRRDGENGRRIEAHGPLEARKAVRCCISYVHTSTYLSHTPPREPISHTLLDGGDDTEMIMVAAFKRYCVSNPLHPDVFPGESSFGPTPISCTSHQSCHAAVRKMEAEIVAMCLRMQVPSFPHEGTFFLLNLIYFNLYRYSHPDGAGSTTSGGTESILMSCKTHRDWALATKGITEPEMYATLGFFLNSMVLMSTCIGSLLHLPMLPLTRPDNTSASK